MNVVLLWGMFVMTCESHAFQESISSQTNKIRHKCTIDTRPYSIERNNPQEWVPCTARMRFTCHVHQKFSWMEVSPLLWKIMLSTRRYERSHTKGATITVLCDASLDESHSITRNIEHNLPNDAMFSWRERRCNPRLELLGKWSIWDCSRSRKQQLDSPTHAFRRHYIPLKSITGRRWIRQERHHTMVDRVVFRHDRWWALVTKSRDRVTRGAPWRWRSEEWRAVAAVLLGHRTPTSSWWSL